MNRNSLVRLGVRLQSPKDSSRFLCALPVVWNGGIKQLMAWAKDKGLRFHPCRQEVLGGHYVDESNGSKYFIEIREDK